MNNIRTLEQKLRSVSNARRLSILTFLKREQSATVGDIATAAQLHITSTSQHLRILKAAGIVVQNKRGRYVTYRLALKQEEPVKKVLSLL